MTADLLRDGPVVANVGIHEFSESIDEQGKPVVQVDWSPPRELEEDLAALLKELS